MGLRKATRDDLPGIVEIYNSTIPLRMSTADTSPVSVESRIEWFNSHTGNRPLYVYEIDDTVVGWAEFRDFNGLPAYRGTAELSIFLAPEFRNRGIGTEILARCIDRSPGLGIDHILCYVFTHNTPSLKLLNRFNFSKWGELPEVAEMDGKKYSLSILGLAVGKLLEKDYPQMTQMNADEKRLKTHLRKSAPSADKDIRE